jgi:hypothetical protein
VNDIDAVAAEIKAKGVEFTREPTIIRLGMRICFIRGPQCSARCFPERRASGHEGENYRPASDAGSYPARFSGSNSAHTRAFEKSR